MANSNNAVDYYHNSRIFCYIDQKIHLRTSFRRVEAEFYSIFMLKIWGKVYPYKCKIYCILEKNQILFPILLAILQLEVLMF